MKTPLQIPHEIILCMFDFHSRHLFVILIICNFLTINAVNRYNIIWDLEFQKFMNYYKNVILLKHTPINGKI